VIVRETSCTGNVLSGKHLVRETSVKLSKTPASNCQPEMTPPSCNMIAALQSHLIVHRQWRVWSESNTGCPCKKLYGTAFRSVQPFLPSSRPPLSPLKIAPSHGGFECPSNKWFLGAIRVLNLNGISINSAIFEGLTTVTNQLIDRPCYLVCNNEPHLCM